MTAQEAYLKADFERWSEEWKRLSKQQREERWRLIEERLKRKRRGISDKSSYEGRKEG